MRIIYLAILQTLGKTGFQLGQLGPRCVKLALDTAPMPGILSSTPLPQFFRLFVAECQ